MSNVTRFLLFLSLFFFCSSAWATQFGLTQSEQVWLDAHPEIKIGLLDDTPPISHINPDGVLEGSDVRLAHRLNEMTGGNMRIVTGNWSTLLSDIKSHRIDVLMTATETVDRLSHILFTRPYVTSPHYIVAREIDKHFANLNALIGHTVALEKNVFSVDYLLKNYPEITIKEFDSPLEALRSVQYGTADAYIGNRVVVDYLLVENGITSLDFHGITSDIIDNMSVGVRSDWPELNKILDRAILSIPHRELHALTNYWQKALSTKINENPFDLTEEESAWIKAHPKIVVGAETDWPPFDFVENGEATGFANDHLRLLSEKAGLNIEFVHGFSWAELLQKIQRKEIDLLPTVNQSDERETFLNLTHPYRTNTESLVVHNDEKNIHSLADMSKKTLVLVNGYATNEKILNKYSEINYIYADNPLDGLIAVSEGRADGFVDYLGVINFLRRENLIPNLRIASTNVTEPPSTDHIGVRKDWPMLVSILEKAMAKVSPAEIEQLKRQWFENTRVGTNKFQLTQEEKAWLSTQGKIRLGFSTSWPPIEFIGEDGNHQGISLDYAKLMEKTLGVEFEKVTAPWQELLRMMQSGQIDILPLINPNPARKKFLTFSSPFQTVPHVIATKINAPFYPHLDDLNGEIVGVGEGYAIQGKLRNDYPDIKLKGYPSIKDALLALNEGRVSAVVMNSMVFNYYLSKLGLQSKLHINNSIPYNDILTTGVRQDLAPLIPIINRFIASITPYEHELITDKWNNLPVIEKIDWRLSLYIIGFSALLILVIVLWATKLHREVTRRRIAEELLLKSDERFRTIFSEVSDCVLIIGVQGNILYVNQAAIEYFKLESSTVTGKSIAEIFSDHPKLLELWLSRIENVFLRLKSSHFKDRTEHNGSTVYYESAVSPILSDLGAVFAVSLVHRDVTTRINSEKSLALLAESKSTLLREVNHRVTNNLTAIVSMLHLERDKVEERDCPAFCSEPLHQLENRISNLLTVHKMLSKTQWSPLPLSELCKEIALQTLSGLLPDQFELQIEESELQIFSDNAHNLALVLGELVNNSAKYAQNDLCKLTIKVAIGEQNGDAKLSYSDNGPGFPDAVLQGKKSSISIGVEMIDGIITGSMNGKIERFNENGACTRISYPKLA